MVMNRVYAVLGVMLLASSVLAATIPDAYRLKDPEGETLAVAVICNQCKGSPKPSAKCMQGVGDGFSDSELCGDCLIRSNWGARIAYPYDVFITGKLQDLAGKPLADQFVKVLLPINGWTVFSRTGSDGGFRAALGATAPRRGKTPLTMDIGTVTYKQAIGKSNAFSIYLLPEHYKPCAPPKAKKKKPAK
jgi:hypothetical protein